MIDLTGKVAVVTGGSRGIGRTAAITLARAGAQVVIADRSDALRTDGGSTSHTICAEGGSARSELLDVSDSAAVDAFFANLVATGGAPDILVNNAGILEGGSVTETSDETWRKLFSVNVDGTFFCMRAAIAAMLAEGKPGKVVNVASISGLRANPGFAGYCSTKAAIVNLTRQAGVDYGSASINVNAVAPGFVDTDMLAIYDDSVRAALEGQTPNGRWADTQHIADTIAFLSSSLSDHICGEVIAVDGGWLVGTPVVTTPAQAVASS